MQLPRKLSRSIYLLLLLFLISSCASVKIDPPGPEVQTILILPYSKLDTTGRSAGYIFHYHIVNLGDDSITFEAKFNQSDKEGYLVVDSLPPGNYRVDKVTVNPVGSGIRDFDRSEYRRNEKFSLVSGKITIFRKSIYITHTKDPIDPGRSSSGFRIDPVFPDRRNNILEKLGKQENFEKWEVIGVQQGIVGLSSNELSELFNRPVLAPDITGSYVSDIKGGEVMNRARIITFKQSGNNITGTWNTDPFHKITGTITGDTIKFEWIEGSATDKEGVWKISADGTRFVGTWVGISGVRSGKFNLTKIK